ncbi:MAG: hypothetical protein Kow00109_07730 [Acidobacteriota bacterium]
MKRLLGAILIAGCVLGGSARAGAQADLVWLRGPCAEGWWQHSLGDTLAQKRYIAGLHRIEPGAALEPDWGRPASLGPDPGGRLAIREWIFWFNDYFEAVGWYERRSAKRRIVVLQPCSAAAGLIMEGKNQGNPFSSDPTLRNYQAVFRHPQDPAGTYQFSGFTYRPLDQIFAKHPDFLFILFTPPPQSSDEADRRAGELARRFADWLKGEWLETYRARYPELNNVAVFDWFELLANSPDHPSFPNLLASNFRAKGGAPSALNETAFIASTSHFAGGADNALDAAHRAWVKQRLFFPQFGGGGGLVSELILSNPTDDTRARILLSFRDDHGNPLALPLAVTPGEAVAEPFRAEEGRIVLELAPGTLAIVRSRPEGELRVGAVRLASSEEVGGVVRFALPGAGIAGVGASPPVTDFYIPVRVEADLNTGIALANAELEAISLDLELSTVSGQRLTGGSRTLSLAAEGHLAQFVDELFDGLHLDDFRGLLRVRASGQVGATALELGTAPGEFTTLPVIPVP